MSIVDSVLRLLEKEEERLERELSGITAAIAAFGKTFVNGNEARSLSSVGRARIAPANAARSPKARKTRKVVPIESKRVLSRTAGKKVAAAQKAKSVKVRAKKSA